MFRFKRLLLLVMLIMIAAMSSGCSTVNYMKDVDKSLNQLKALNDQLNVAKRNADSPAFGQLLDEMNEETDRVNDLDPGWMMGKLSKEVREKNETISGLIGEIKREANTGAANSEKLDSLMKQLSDEIEEAVE